LGFRIIIREIKQKCLLLSVAGLVIEYYN